MKRNALPRGFAMPPNFYSEMPWPDGVKETLQLIISRTFGKRSVCPLTVKGIASLRGKCRQTITSHLAFLEDRGQIRLEAGRRGDRRSRQIVLLFREQDEDLSKAIEKQASALPGHALLPATMQSFKAECKAKKGCKPAAKRMGVKESRGEYVA